MLASRGFTALAGVTALTLAGLLTASPASAATLPDGQRITVIANEFTGDNEADNTYLHVNPADASGTQVGAVSSTLVTSFDVDDDGLGYGTGVVSDGQIGGDVPMLYPVDAASGVTGPGVPIVPVDPAVTITNCQGIDYSDGVITLACVNQPDAIAFAYLGTVTPDGDFTVFYNSVEQDETTYDFSAIAVDPVSGTLWAFGRNSDFLIGAWPVDRSSDPWTIGDMVIADEVPWGIWGADFDRDGQLFITISTDAPDQLATFALDTGVTSVVGFFTVDGIEPGNVAAITVWGKKALPATGPAELLPIGLGMALLLLAGTAFVATARIQRRTERA